MSLLPRLLCVFLLSGFALLAWSPALPSCGSEKACACCAPGQAMDCCKTAAPKPGLCQLAPCSGENTAILTMGDAVESIKKVLDIRASTLQAIAGVPWAQASHSSIHHLDTRVLAPPGMGAQLRTVVLLT